MPARPTLHRLPGDEPVDAGALTLRLQRRLADCADLRAILALLAQELPLLVPARDRVSLAFVEPDGEHLRVYKLLPGQDSPPDDLPRVRMDGTVVGEVARDGRPRVVADVRSDDNLRFGRASHDGVRSTASVPVRVGGRVVGVMNVGSRQVDACHDGMLESVAAVAAVVGPALYAAERALATVPMPRPAVTSQDQAGWIGASPIMADLLGQARRAARSDATVLLTGETGVGKSLLANAIHGWSPRREQALHTVNLADLPPTLVESELFGHERGAFTGAAQRRTGRFEAASGGTLFLDEIGEAPLTVQSKLLRLTQDGCFERLGGNATLRTDVRLIAATNRDLHEAVTAGQFRRDLLYRLEIVALHIPPLRQRPEDLEPLARAILARLARKQGRPLALSPAAWSRLHAHAWPGNVRELESVLVRAAVLEEGDQLELRGLDPKRPQPDSPPREDWPSRDEHEKRYLCKVLQHTAGRIEGPGGAARLLGLTPSTLRSRLQRLGLDLQAVRHPGRK